LTPHLVPGRAEMCSPVFLLFRHHKVARISPSSFHILPGTIRDPGSLCTGRSGLRSLHSIFTALFCEGRCSPVLSVLVNACGSGRAAGGHLSFPPHSHPPYPERKGGDTDAGGKGDREEDPGCWCQRSIDDLCRAYVTRPNGISGQEIIG